MPAEMWIVIPNWDSFQHYKDRTPKWIKTYVELMSDDAYLGLTGNRRALLHGLWLEYAMARTSLGLDVQMINRRLQLNVKMKDLEALRDAGFIQFSASRALARPEQNRSLEESREEKNPPTPLPGGQERRSAEERRAAKKAARPPRYLAGVTPIWNAASPEDRDHDARIWLEGFTSDPDEVQKHLDHLHAQEAAA